MAFDASRALMKLRAKRTAEARSEAAQMPYRTIEIARRAGETAGSGAEPGGRAPARLKASKMSSSEKPCSRIARAISTSLESLR